MTNLHALKKGYNLIGVVFFCILSPAGFGEMGTDIEVTRLNDGKPILTTEHFQSVGATAREAANINGPSVIRVPSWIPVHERPATDAKYYMYFGHHQGQYIRMAHAPTPVGPWRLFNIGEEAGRSLGDPAKGISSRATPGRGVLDLKIGDSPHIDTGSFLVRGHVASPDARLDPANQRIILYFHAPSSTKRQETFVATSRYGLNFNRTEDGGEDFDGIESGVRDVIPGRFYFRTFEVGGRSFAYANQAELYRAPAKTVAGNPATLANADEAGGIWNPTPEADRAEYWELVDKGDNPVQRIYDDLGRRVTDPRHFAVLHDPEVDPDRIYIFYTAKGDKPERILLTEVDLAGLNDEERTEPSNWRIRGPAQRVMLEPEEVWEGADLPLTRSKSSAATGVRELRDPFVFRDDDGEIYLFYAGRGEEAIGVARVAIRGPASD